MTIKAKDVRRLRAPLAALVVAPLILKSRFLGHRPIFLSKPYRGRRRAISTCAISTCAISTCAKLVWSPRSRGAQTPPQTFAWRPSARPTEEAATGRDPEDTDCGAKSIKDRDPAGHLAPTPYSAGDRPCCPASSESRAGFGSVCSVAAPTQRLRHALKSFKTRQRESIFFTRRQDHYRSLDSSGAEKSGSGLAHEPLSQPQQARRVFSSVSPQGAPKPAGRATVSMTR